MKTQILIALGPPINAVVVCEAECGDYYAADVLRKDGYDADRVAEGVVVCRGKKRRFLRETIE